MLGLNRIIKLLKRKPKPEPPKPQIIEFPEEHTFELLEKWDRKANLDLEGKAFQVAEYGFWKFAHKHCPELDGKLWDICTVCGVRIRFTEKLD